MISTTANFQAALAAYRNGPIIKLITIQNYSRVFTNYQTGVSGQYNWLVSMDDTSININDLEGGADQTTLNFTVRDVGGAITAAFPSFTFEGKIVTVQIGFVGLARADFATIWTGYVDQVDSANSNLEYYFTCLDISSKLNQVVYQTGDNGLPTSSDNIKTLSGHPLNILLDILQNQITGLGAQYIDSNKIIAYRDGPFAGIQFVYHLSQAPAAGDFIKSQILKQLGGYLWVNAAGQITVNFFAPLLGPNAQYKLSPLVRSINNPWKATDATYPYTNFAGGTPITIAVSLNQSITIQYVSGTLRANVFSEVTPYDADGNPGTSGTGGGHGNDSQHPGKYTATCNSGALLGAFTDASGNVISTPFLIGVGPVTKTVPNGAAFLSIGVNTTRFDQGDGAGWLLSVTLQTPSFSTVTLGPSSWTTVPAAEQTTMVNTVLFQFDKDDATPDASGNYGAQTTEEYAPSVSAYGQFGEVQIQADGMRAAFQGFLLAFETARLIFFRYGLKNLTFNQNAADAQVIMMLLEPGDVVDVTHSQIPDRKAGVIGITNKPFEILNKTIKWTDMVVNLTMLDASYLNNFGSFLFTPDAQGTFAASSSGDRAKYMFMCNDSDVYSTGDPGNVLG